MKLEWLHDEFVIFIEGTPRPQPRPRMINGKVVSIVDDYIRRWKNKVMNEFIKGVRNRCDGVLKKYIDTVDGALRVDLDFYFLTDDPDMDGEYHVVVPDKDNLEKLVLDALHDSKVLFSKDDSQVAIGQTAKYWSTRKQGVFIRIQRASESGRKNDASINTRELTRAGPGVELSSCPETSCPEEFEEIKLKELNLDLFEDDKPLGF